MRCSAGCSNLAKGLLPGFIIVLLASAGTGMAQQERAAKSAPVNLKGEILQGIMPGRANKNISSICDLSNATVNGIAAGPYSGTFTEKILTFRNEPRKLAFSGNFEIVISSSKEKVTGHIEGYDPNSEGNHCSVSPELPGSGDFSSQFVAQYTAEIVTAEGSCKVSGKAKIVFSGAIRAKVIIPGSSFQAEILDSTACGDHSTGTK
jgi:hypothetical protein